MTRSARLAGHFSWLLPLCVLCSSVSSSRSFQENCGTGPCLSRHLSETDVNTSLDSAEEQALSLQEPEGEVLEQSNAHEMESRQLLDIVIAHFNEWNEWTVRPFWEVFLATPKIQELNPYVYVYCQNPNLDEEKMEKIFGSVVVRGRIIFLDNKGREGRVYLHHIVHNYDRLARHTIFSQDDPGERWLPEAPILPRMQSLFTPELGVLALSEVFVTYCDEPRWVDNAGVETHLMYETYAMITGRHCPQTGFAGIYKGQFMASARRIQMRSRDLYTEMLQLIEADAEHPVHKRHNAEHFKTQANPYIGHVYERSWSLLLGCYGPDNPGAWIDACRDCEAKKYTGCPKDACGCLDPAAHDETHSVKRISIRIHNTTRKYNL